MEPVTNIAMNLTANHERMCTANEIKETACLNGGKCFAIAGPHGPIPTCLCPFDFSGVRCEEYYPKYDFSNPQPACLNSVSAIIAVLGAVIGVLLLLLLLALFYIKKQKRSMSSQNGKHSNTSKPPLVQQISYSNYHGVRVVHSQGSVEIPSHQCVVTIPQNEPGFLTFSSAGQEAMSDYGGSHDQIDPTPLNSGYRDNNNSQSAASNDANNNSDLKHCNRQT